MANCKTGNVAVILFVEKFGFLFLNGCGLAKVHNQWMQETKERY